MTDPYLRPLSPRADAELVRSATEKLRPDNAMVILFDPREGKSYAELDKWYGARRRAFFSTWGSAEHPVVLAVSSLSVRGNWGCVLAENIDKSLHLASSLLALKSAGVTMARREDPDVWSRLGKSRLLRFGWGT